MIDKKAEVKIVDGKIRPTDWQKIHKFYRDFVRLSKVVNWPLVAYNSLDITNIKNDIIVISQIISKEFPHFSSELFMLKDHLFIDYGCLDQQVYGQIIAICKALVKEVDNPAQSVWGLVHPKIESVAKQLYLDGHYANAAEDAFVEINDRVKKLYKIINAEAQNIPDGDTVMTTVFSAKNPMLKLCDTTTESGQNEQKGLMLMLQGAMAALRNPKAHANITITADDAMRRIMFASLLMYKIDDAVKYSNVNL